MKLNLESLENKLAWESYRMPQYDIPAMAVRTDVYKRQAYKSAQVLKVRQSSLSNKGYDNPQIVLLETQNGCRIDVEVQEMCIRDRYQPIFENGVKYFK